uniref:Uncharacterized protein n=1 Tax=viral metagenome TaxID=1070528 RepID=A0A6M3KTJ4_9ZZZZ
MVNYEDWVEKRAVQIADTQYARDFYDLTEDTQRRIFKEAEADFVDYFSMMAEAAYDRIRDQGVPL